jgi:hypothetical protein
LPSWTIRIADVGRALGAGGGRVPWAEAVDAVVAANRIVPANQACRKRFQYRWGWRFTSSLLLQDWRARRWWSKVLFWFARIPCNNFGSPLLSDEKPGRLKGKEGTNAKRRIIILQGSSQTIGRRRKGGNERQSGNDGAKAEIVKSHESLKSGKHGCRIKPRKERVQHFQGQPGNAASSRGVMDNLEHVSKEWNHE